MLAGTGIIYERAAIEEWLAKAYTDPLTNEQLLEENDRLLVPNRVMRAAITEWREKTKNLQEIRNELDHLLQEAKNIKQEAQQRRRAEIVARAPRPKVKRRRKVDEVD